jgi:anti-anti-sigma regulatory factor
MTDDWDAAAVDAAGPAPSGQNDEAWGDPAPADLADAGLAFDGGDPSSDASADDWDGAVEGPPVLSLPARPSAEELRRALLPLLSQDGGALAIDAAEVERLPMPVVQVLLAAIRELKAAGRVLTVRNPSFAFGLAFEALGYAGEREIFTVEYC